MVGASVTTRLANALRCTIVSKIVCFWFGACSAVAPFANRSAVAQPLQFFVPDAPHLHDMRQKLHAELSPDNKLLQFLPEIVIHEGLLRSQQRTSSLVHADLVFLPIYAATVYKRSNRKSLQHLSENFVWKLLSATGSGRQYVIVHSSTAPVAHVFPTTHVLLKLPNVHVLTFEGPAENHREGAHQMRPEKDVLIPYFISGVHVGRGLELSRTPIEHVRKPYFITFVGSLTHMDRLRLVEAVHQTQLPEGWGYHVDLLEDDCHPVCDIDATMDFMRKSVFCPIPQGRTATSRRLYEAILNECIPVLWGNAFQVPFSRLVGVDSFVVRFPGEVSMPSLKKQLAELVRMPFEEISLRMRLLRRAKTLFLYSGRHIDLQGPSALDALLAELLLLREQRLHEEAPVPQNLDAKHGAPQAETLHLNQQCSSSTACSQKSVMRGTRPDGCHRFDSGSKANLNFSSDYREERIEILDMLWGGQGKNEMAI